MNENIFRILAAIILFTSVGISAYFRRKADNGFIAALGISTFIMAIRTPKEGANLIEKFWNEYREYRDRTGRFFPKIGA